jgi:hypothetical protein
MLPSSLEFAWDDNCTKCCIMSWARINLSIVQQKTEKTVKREASQFISSPKTMEIKSKKGEVGRCSLDALKR